ncbi:SDR family oxidoreductase [Ectopseudomonas hydrolytica]|uniref:Short-chain dehydrogenase/reductase SDR n=2 Tax=Ectopseudomonas TaxID=3236654 RepID=A4XUP8_ECTM1|nr:MULTISPECIES: SDR family oxidoreductase [Pseudomonas]ARS48945.1 short-chain dehydrogenase [Pseudomonas mendocina]ATH82222.1 NAD(P)-dependent oxidoreductase [Pseudomonas mendocina]MDH0098289.1 SDR family oxidoreductase [Pseudomonas sp. GD04158]USR41963.1 SDR family oxidoreductase [Pseudomonas hydrolytica]
MNDKTLPAQHQDRQPGLEHAMHPEPVYLSDSYRAADKLAGKVAIITGGDSGIGRAVAVHYALEGAKVALVYLDENEDAQKTVDEVTRHGSEAIALAGDVGDAGFCQCVVDAVIAKWGRLDILINNAGEQHPKEDLLELEEADWERTFRTNILAMFQLTKVALRHLQSGASIINTSSVTAYKGNPMLLDYSSTKGAITSFTRSLAINLAPRGIRVNGVAPGPIWTPLIPSTFSADKVAEFGADTPLGRPGQPSEVAPAYVYLASNDASYMTGQMLHVNGGSVVNG